MSQDLPAIDCPTLDMSSLPSLFATEAAAQARSAQASLPADVPLTYRRHAVRRDFRDLRRGNAAKTLDRLPTHDESIHGLMGGAFDAWDFVGGILRLSGGATIRHLLVATLGYNSRGCADLFDRLDRGEIERVDFVCSAYFRAADASEWATVYEGLSRRGQRCVAIRCHAKLLAFEMSDGSHYVLEMSANLRSCKNIEQFVLTHDADLFRFHATWIDAVISEALRQ